jgi:hypothetical protein
MPFSGLFDMSKSSPRSTGLRQFLTTDQQHDWIEGKTDLLDAAERSDSLELRLKYVPRFHKLLVRLQAPTVLSVLRLYCQNCLPMPRTTELEYWSVSCLPSTSDKPLVRVNASWMELFTIYADQEDIRARFIVHLSDFTNDHSHVPGQLDATLSERCAAAPKDMSYFFPRGDDIFGVNVRGSAAIHKALASPQMLSAIRRFNLTHMNRGRNAYQASHSYSVADHMLEG